MHGRLAREDGFTLIELLVVMVISLVVLGATLTAFERFTDSQRRASDAADAQDVARTQVRAAVAELREARIATNQTAPIPSGWTVSRSDLVVATYLGPDATAVPGWVRYCVEGRGAGRGATLVRGTRVGDTYLPPGPCTASAAVNGWVQSPVVTARVLDQNQLFDYASATCAGAACLPAAADVRTVGIRLAVARRADTTSLASVVRDAVSFRNRP